MTWSAQARRLVELHLGSGDVAGQLSSARDAAPGALQLGHRLLPLRGDGGAPLLERRDVGPGAEVGELRLGQPGAQHGELAVVLLDLPVERGEPALGEQRPGGRQDVVEAGGLRPLLRRSAGGVGGDPGSQLVGLGASTSASQRRRGVGQPGDPGGQVGVVAGGGGEARVELGERGRERVPLGGPGGRVPPGRRPAGHRPPRARPAAPGDRLGRVQPAGDLGDRGRGDRARPARPPAVDRHGARPGRAPGQLALLRSGVRWRWPAPPRRPRPPRAASSSAAVTTGPGVRGRAGCSTEPHTGHRRRRPGPAASSAAMPSSRRARRSCQCSRASCQPARRGSPRRAVSAVSSARRVERLEGGPAAAAAPAARGGGAEACGVHDQPLLLGQPGRPDSAASSAAAQVAQLVRDPPRRRESRGPSGGPVDVRQQRGGRAASSRSSAATGGRASRPPATAAQARGRRRRPRRPARPRAPRGPPPRRTSRTGSARRPASRSARSGTRAGSRASGPPARGRPLPAGVPLLERAGPASSASMVRAPTGGLGAAPVAFVSRSAAVVRTPCTHGAT